MYTGNKIICDCHLHSRFSSDSSEEPENIIKKAISLGLERICFTEHNDFDYPPCDGQEGLFNLDFETYSREINRLKELYSGKITILTGVEQGLISSVADKVNPYKKNEKLDFIIGSSHLVYGEDPYYPEFWEEKNVFEVINTYYESIVDNLETCENFDVYGHIDYILRFAPGKDTAYDWKQNIDIIEHILKLLIQKGKGIEINTAGLKYGLSYPNPRPEILSMYRQLGGEIITIGSDAHSSDYVGYNFDIAEQMLCQSGFKYYCMFKNRKPEFLPL